MRRALTSTILLGASLVSGCVGIDLSEPIVQPADAVRQILYMRNLSADPFYYQIHGSHPVPPEGHVSDRPATTGCGWVGPDWVLIVTDGDTRPADPADEFAAEADADEFSGEDPVTISLSIEPDGAIVIEEGVPPWWFADIQRCP